MMNLLQRFAVMTLLSGTVLSLLPEGSIRRTASMAAGLLMLLFWADGLGEVLRMTEAILPPAAPNSIFSPTGAALDAASQSAADALTGIWEGAP